MPVCWMKSDFLTVNAVLSENCATVEKTAIEGERKKQEESLRSAILSRNVRSKPMTGVHWGIGKPILLPVRRALPVWLLWQTENHVFSCLRRFKRKTHYWSGMGSLNCSSSSPLIRLPPLRRTEAKSSLDILKSQRLWMAFHSIFPTHIHHGSEERTKTQTVSSESIVPNQSISRPFTTATSLPSLLN